ncbi:MAG: 3-phosphoglycerate dehydrogenase [Candidatus Cloacimonetes bacterium]|jgi:D-3-phosphoglycerate dehydrogenase|nr:3-phosphoglycerate dehydrogenase [Candidatus Cloacimonadota bacterium]MDD4156149.1 3-phosphoglycerate dehydrogenase [Candidatus Cloacimonadota bacterium]
MSKRVLLATEKPFAAPAVKGIEEIFSKAGYELIKLESYQEKADLLKAVENVDAMIIRSDKADKEVIEATKNLKIVVRAGAGYDNIDLETATAKNVVAMNTPGQNSNAVAELVIGMMIYLARGKYNGKSGSELRGKKIGIHAYGNVGRFVANIAKGFGMEVYAYDPFVAKAKMEAEGIKVVDKMEDLYKKCEYVSLHLPKTKETVNSINYDLLSLMPKGATLINTARKEVVCEKSIVKIMTERKDFRYATDIAPDNNDEMMDKFADRYFATPKKMGAQTEEANVNAGLASANQIVNFFEKGDITFKVNK